MAKAPPIPPEQRSHPGDKPHVEGGHMDRRDARTDLQSGAPGDEDANLREQGRYGNRKQNVDDVQHKVQDR